MNKIILIITAVIFVLMFSWIGAGYFIVSGLEEPAYSVIKKNDFYEIRQYSDYIIAETTVDGEYKEAVNKGFRIIADYIFGNNVSKKKFSMTTPVVTRESLSEKIAMTTPVISSQKDKQWSLSFVMPKKYTLETLPKPKTDRISFRKVQGKKTAVHRFTWYVTEKRLKEKTLQLISALEKDGYVIEDIQSARYNPPFSPPFMYRNEVWAVLKE